MCDCYNDHRSHRAIGKILRPHQTAYIPQRQNLSIGTLSDLRRQALEAWTVGVSVKLQIRWERGFANKHTM